MSVATFAQPDSALWWWFRVIGISVAGQGNIYSDRVTNDGSPGEVLRISTLTPPLSHGERVCRGRNIIKSNTVIRNPLHVGDAEDGATVTVTNKGQAMIPKEFLDRLQIETLARVWFVENETGEAVIHPVKRPSELRGALASETEMEESERSATELLRGARTEQRRTGAIAAKRMTVVFDTEPLLAFSFDEHGASTVKRWLDQVYDRELALLFVLRLS